MTNNYIMQNNVGLVSTIKDAGNSLYQNANKIVTTGLVTAAILGGLTAQVNAAGLKALPSDKGAIYVQGRNIPGFDNGRAYSTTVQSKMKINMLDTNGDGKLSRPELYLGCNDNRWKKDLAKDNVSNGSDYLTGSGRGKKTFTLDNRFRAEQTQTGTICSS